MVYVISQDTFDEAVQENITEFGLTPQEAIKDAVKQFEAQGADLTRIVQDNMASTSTKTQTVMQAVKKLDDLKNTKTLKTPEEYLEQLSIIKRECDKGLQYRIVAAKEGGYSAILATMLRHNDNPEVKQECLKSMVSLMTKQPDLLDEKGLQTMIDYIVKEQDPEIQRLVLKWIKESCIMHETNRQQIFDADILDHLKPLLEDASSSLLRDVLGVLRALVLDDDIRVEFGRSHEHARAIASDTLCSITSLLDKHKKDEPLMSDLMITLSALLVRTEFCKKVEDAGGLDLIKEVMTDFSYNEKLMRQCLKLLKVLSGNDECKAHIIQKGFAPIIATAISSNKSVLQTANSGLACVAALTLRSAESSKAFFNNDLPTIIIECMKLHPEDINVQKLGSWAIRNMVSRSRYQTSKFLKLGAEGVLQKNIKKFKSCEYDFKAALRDLGCQVELKEEWTGKGGMLTTEEK